MALNKEPLALLREYATNFADHWIDDDTPEEQAAAEKARDQIDAAHDKIAAERSAARAMLTALEYAHAYITSRRKDQTAIRMDEVALLVARAMDAARASGIQAEALS